MSKNNNAREHKPLFRYEIERINFFCLPCINNMKRIAYIDTSYWQSSFFASLTIVSAHVDVKFVVISYEKAVFLTNICIHHFYILVYVMICFLTAAFEETVPRIIHLFVAVHTVEKLIKRTENTSILSSVDLL